MRKNKIPLNQVIILLIVLFTSITVIIGCYPEEEKCKLNRDCNSGEYCEKKVGHCGGKGECVEMASGCPEILDPVCGCDGITYDNDCFAAEAGVNIAYEGLCDPVSIQCTSNSDCLSISDNSYCAKEPGDCDGKGLCEPKPDACYDVWAPVCGCDGNTYGNDCEAAAAGVNIDHEGECEPVSTSCTTNDECLSNMHNTYCAKLPSDCDGEGLCELKPEICYEIYAPVCGCDGNTYANDCMAAAAGINIDYIGECDTVSIPCTINDDCSLSMDNTYCAKAPADCDGEGVCELKPKICLDIWDPVCGCDGITYGNACEAAEAGVSINSYGDCGPVSVPCTTNDECSLGTYNLYCAKIMGDCDSEGICKLKPEICPYIWVPVCGCDGNTYGNHCEAGAAGVNIKHESECLPVTIPCSTNIDCSSTMDNTYCAKMQGDCDGEGICELKPEYCPDIWDPVCGCDSNTYGNECEAADAEVNIDYMGECDPATISCVTNDDCSTSKDYAYCAKETGSCDDKGVCRQKPEICPMYFDPVCGCDGNTYSNECVAASNGVSVDYKGECKPDPKPCASNDDCSTSTVDSYCAREPGYCDGDGVCLPKPDICPDVWDPVCGCDGNTYGNGCESAAAGINIDFKGECQLDYCHDNEMCGKENYCDFAECANETGICQPRPENCPMLWEPVCGCDGYTYSNSCVAASKGISVDYKGECKPDPKPCASNDDCSTSTVDSYCAREPGYCDGDGVCEPKPEICPHVWAPVCGCDGNTYGNSCEAAAAGVNVEYKGRCDSISIPCRINEDCLLSTDNTYCTKEQGDCDGAGVCKPKPDACYDVWDPVCGCDGNTYGNDCEAAAAGVNINYIGVCKQKYCFCICTCENNKYSFFKPCAIETEYCTERPDACQEIYQPVCAYNSVSYTDACDAIIARMSFLNEITCNPDDCYNDDQYGDCDCSQIICITCEYPYYKIGGLCPED